MSNNILSLPGVMIAHSPARTRQYIGSPSIAVLPDGSYAAAMTCLIQGQWCWAFLQDGLDL